MTHPFTTNKIVRLFEVNSTNDYTTSRIKDEGWEEGVVVCAKYQTNGHGQINNVWESESGQNLLCSFILRPQTIPISNQFLISKAVSLAVVGTLSPYVDNISIKWPNDIYIGDKKIAGILIENSILGSTIEYSVAGIGLNINQSKFISNAPNPISLKQATGKEFDVDNILNSLIEKMGFWYKLVSCDDTKKLDEAYVNKLYLKGKESSFEDCYGMYKGTIQGVDDIGRLIIKPSDNTPSKYYHFKEVKFVLQ